jgi:hypothetical protein
MVIGVIVDVMTGGRGVELLIDQESNSTHKKTANQEN